MSEVDQGRSSEPRPDYLRRLVFDVNSAMALIVHDLVSTGVADVAAAEVIVRIATEDHLRLQTEIGLGVSATETAFWVAEAIQEELIEGLDRRPRLVTWPPCPEHPHHPLWLVSVDGNIDPAWTCPTSGRPVAELGRL